MGAKNWTHFKRSNCQIVRKMKEIHWKIISQLLNHSTSFMLGQINFAALYNDAIMRQINTADRQGIFPLSKKVVNCTIKKHVHVYFYVCS